MAHLFTQRCGTVLRLILAVKSISGTPPHLLVHRSSRGYFWVWAESLSLPVIIILFRCGRCGNSNIMAMVSGDLVPHLKFTRCGRCGRYGNYKKLYTPTSYFILVLVFFYDTQTICRSA